MILTVCLIGFFSTGAGTTALPILKTPVGPRPAAMGEAFSALADDATALYWNPAGLGNAKTGGLFLSHQEWLRGIRDEYVCMALPVKVGRLGLGLTYSGVSGIEAWNEFNRREPAQEVSNHTAIFAAGYGLPIGRRLRVGGGVKVAYDYLGQASSSGLGTCLDAGVQFKPASYLDLGASIGNAGAAKYLADDGFFLLPTTLRLGAAWRWRELTLASDFVLPIDNGPTLNLGTEYVLFNTICLRAGYKTGPQDLSSLGMLSGMCVGFGLNLGRFSFDYAFAPYGDLGNTHRFGLRTTAGSGGSGRVKIVTVDARTGDPIAAEVEVSGIRDARMTTRLDGRAYLNRMGEGQVMVRVSSPGYLPVVDSCFSWGDRDQTKTVGLSKPGRGAIRGSISSAETNQAIRGIVTYRGPATGQVETEPQRLTYVIRDLPDGEYVVTAYGLGALYQPEACTLQVEDGRFVTRDFFLSHPGK